MARRQTGGYERLADVMAGDVASEIAACVVVGRCTGVAHRLAKTRAFFNEGDHG